VQETASFKNHRSYLSIFLGRNVSVCKKANKEGNNAFLSTDKMQTHNFSFDPSPEIHNDHKRTNLIFATMSWISFRNSPATSSALTFTAGPLMVFVEERRYAVSKLESHHNCISRMRHCLGRNFAADCDLIYS
jgi:hypothetical protein